MTRTLFRSLAFILLLSATQQALAASNNQTRLFLMVQQQGEPLFKKVDLIIYKLEKLAAKKPIYHSERHTAALSLPTGQYMAQVRYENQLIRQQFQLSSHENHFITLDIPSSAPTTLSAR
ncbi:MAG: hypothetical protein WAQ53_13795 [Thiofilum sp.]|uniref:hypothetical protein n=1 Tax=Thiofilum sp. TaxID=2212733 RepID=UPI0025E7E9B6|nr:hypothetical protein [Thiofilum sp.]MBK8453972.1 hypothetical protein [Thiofilum sp.]